MEGAGAARNLATISEEVIAAQGATSRDLRVEAGKGAAVKSEATRATSEKKCSIPMGQETAPIKKKTFLRDRDIERKELPLVAQAEYWWRRQRQDPWRQARPCIWHC